MSGCKRQQQLEILKESTFQYIRFLHQQEMVLKYEKPWLESFYTIKIGCWNIERLRLQLEIKSLKLKNDILKSSIRECQSLDLIDMQLAVAAELAFYETKILKHELRVESAEQFQHSEKIIVLPVLAEEYIKLASMLHPSLNEDLTVNQLELWQKISDKKTVNDVEQLRSYIQSCKREINDAKCFFENLNEHQLDEKIHKVSCLIHNTHAAIIEIKGSFPFNIEKQLEDSDWVNAELERIHDELNDLRECEQEEERIFTGMLLSL